MDKLRGIGWVGGIYKKFEELCHDMDNIVNQDNVKYVENQAQNLGESTTRLYSDVILPLKHEDQEISLKRCVTIDASFESKAAIQEDHINTVCKLSHVEPVAVDPTEKQFDHASNELCLPVEIVPTDVDVLDGAESGTISQQVSDVRKTTSCEVSIEGDTIKEDSSGSNVPELASLGEEESFGDSLANKFIDCNDKISSRIDCEVSLTMLVNGIEFQSPEKETRVSDNITVHVAEKELECAFSELCLVDQPGNPNFADSLLGKQYVTSEQASDLVSSTMEKPLAPEVSAIVSSFEKESSGSSLLNKFIDCNDKEMYSKAELVSHNVHSSSMLAAPLSNDELTVAVSVSSSNELSMDPLGPVDDSTDDISISSMETIELYDEVKLEDNCVIPDSTALYAISRIMSRRKSYKKRIQDALTSRKRLSKEYEQLAIWFGDADMGPVYDTRRPSSSTSTSEPKNTQTELVCDSDWELL